MTFAAAVAVTMLVACIPSIAQQTTPRVSYVTVTDPMNRFVTGLDRSDFHVTEGGVAQQIASISPADSPMALAIVADTEGGEVKGLVRPDDELILTKSIDDATRQLAGSRHTRQTLIIASALEGTRALPGGMLIIKTEPEKLQKVVVEVRNQYLLRWESATPSAPVTITVKAPRGLPPLSVHPFLSTEPRP